MPTFREITDEMKKLRDPSIYANYQVRTFVTQASPGTKQVMYKGTVQGEEMEYPVYVQFRQVEFSDEEKEGFVPYETKDREGNPIMKYYKIPELDHNNVALKCQCSDFRFFWEFPLYRVGSLIGSFRRYVRKTTTRPPKNPDNIVGYCKHLFSLIQALKASNLVK